MSGPAEPSARRAVKANQSPLGEYAADWPTSTTSLAISIAPGADADGEIVIADAVGGADSVGWIRGLGAGVAEVDAAAVTSGASEGDFEADGGALSPGCRTPSRRRFRSRSAPVWRRRWRWRSAAPGR